MVDTGRYLGRYTHTILYLDPAFAPLKLVVLPKNEVRLSFSWWYLEDLGRQK